MKKKRSNIFTPEFKAKVIKAQNSIVSGIEVNGTMFRWLGFMISQVFWIWLLIPFSKFLFNYFIYMGITRYTDITQDSFLHTFWMLYVIYLVVSLVSRIEIPTKEVKHE